ncbi:MAG: ATP-binding protein [candidate division KSB1 bacterium]|nr:ATP-binding protein [candidate division KSB1 bacterium]MDZ7304822.1 ATP-binding protein [candidate division KSB1 bacterium]MDZ7313902.1 ATP-binding protein [candidate division KSB1 bacterium]
MEIFFLWLAVTLILLAGYLSFLWWRPGLPFYRRAGRKSGRFQVRLTMLFLLFALVPVVPLIFLVSSLYTRSMEVLLVPKIETSLRKGIDAIKFELEERARLLENATRNITLTPEILSQWGIDFCLVWRQDSATIRLVSVVGADDAGRQRGLNFDMNRIVEVWGDAGSELYKVSNTGSGDSTTATYCQVWLPRQFLGKKIEGRDANSSLDAPKREVKEMVVIGFQIDPRLRAAKDELTEAARVYNTLALMKESLLQDKILWSAAGFLIMLLGAFSVYAARRFSQSLSRPIEALTSTMAKVANGNLDMRTEIPARDEIGILVNSFNQMIEDLRTSRQKLIASERMAAWREVARQVSHEIKNPLSSIQLALYRVRQRIPTTNGQRSAIEESFQSIDEELAGLKHLAEEFSDFARLPRAQLSMGNLNEVIQMTARLYEAGSLEKMKMHLDLDPELPPRPIDREQIKRLLNNLLKNALEAVPDRRCEVHIVTRRQDERALLEIVDNGPGLTPEAREHLFEPSFTTKREGSGLGLVMVKRIVDEHGGKIEVESEAGKGTRFRIVI